MTTQFTQGTKSSFTIVERLDGNKVLVQGMYDTTTMTLSGFHACGGELVSVGSAWADHTYCCGCGYSAYYPLGD